jgi:chemotaxis protein MotA
MIVIIGTVIVTASVLGGFMLAGGNPIVLLHLSEFVIILGCALGSLVIMAPKNVLLALFKQLLATLKGAPFTKETFEELFKALYELFMLGRRNGMIALEEHVVTPESSSIFSKYPTFIKNHHAVEFLCSGLKPIIDGKVKPDQLEQLMEIELDALYDEHHAPIGVLQKVGDAMPGFGIVAAVLGIVITMGAISGPIEVIGHKVAAALVGTFLGILVSYGYINPLTVTLEFMASAEGNYMKCIASSVSGFANGMAPIMAVETARRSLPSDVKPSADELDEMLKSLNSK